MTITEKTTRQVFITSNQAADTDMAVIIPFYDPTDLVIEQEVAGVTTPMVLGVDYTLSGGTGSGGTLTNLNLLPASSNWVVVRAMPQTQEIDLENQGTILPSAIEEALDRLVMLLLDTDDSSTRSVKADQGEIDPTGLAMPDLATRASKILQWDALGEITAVNPTDVDLVSIPHSAFGTAWVNFATALLARNNLRVFHGTNAAKSATPAAGDIYFTDDTLEIYYCKVTNTWLLMSASQATTVKPNLIINGSAQINQRVTCNSGSTFPSADFGFCLDHVLVASDTDVACTVVQNTADAPDGASHCFEINSAINSKKIGLIFPLDAAQSASLLSAGNDRVCSVRFKHKASSGVRNLRAQIISWQGSADALADPVADAAWAAETVLPSLTGAWTYEGGGAEFLTGTSWAEKTITNIAIDTASTQNLALFIWCDDTDLLASTDKFYLGDIWVNEGADLAPHSRPTFQNEYDACQRFFQKTFPQATEPGQNKGEAGAVVSGAWTGVNRQVGVQVVFRVPLRATPSMVYYNPSANNAQWREVTDNADGGAVTTQGLCDTSVYLLHASVTAIQGSDLITIHYTADAEITV